MFRFTIRDLLWLMAFAGLTILWYTERNERVQLTREQKMTRLQNAMMERRIVQSDSALKAAYQGYERLNDVFKEHLKTLRERAKAQIALEQERAWSDERQRALSDQPIRRPWLGQCD